MNEENSEQNAETDEQSEELSKADAMAGVFTAPGETFETIANAPKKNYWIIPLLIAIVLSVVGTFLFMQDAELSRKTMDKTRAKMSEKFDENVKDGKMKQEDADKALDSMDPNSTMFKIIGFGGAIFGPFIILFVPFIFYLIILKISKAEFEISNILNVIGLAMLIVALGNLIALVISVLRGEMSSIGLGLVLNEESVGDKVYALLSKLDVFNIWFYIVVAIGLSKIARIEFSKAVIIAFIPFILYLGLTLLTA